MKLSLYQIQSEYQLLAEQLIENGGESSEEMEIALRINKEDLTTKGTNYGFIVKDLENDCEAIDNEIARLTAFKKSRVNTIDRLKNNLSTAMQLYGIEKLDSPVLKISFRKSESVEIINQAQLDAKFLVEKTTVTPDKKAISEAIKKGETVEGAVLKQNKNIQIK